MFAKLLNLNAEERFPTKVRQKFKTDKGERFAQRLDIISCEKSDEQVRHQELRITLLLVIPPTFNAA